MTYRSHLVGLIVNPGANSPKLWHLVTTSALTAADASGFITDGFQKGMRRGDYVLVQVAGTAGAASTYEQARVTITSSGCHMVMNDPTEASPGIDLSDNYFAAHGNTD